MTSRRSIKHWDQKLSRALHFQPGHLGGRIASAQPIERRGGTVHAMGVRVGAPVVPPAVPTHHWTFDEASGTFLNTGIAGTATLKSTFGTSNVFYQQSPLVAGSTYSVKVNNGNSLAKNSTDFPALTPGPTGFIVFDWWMSGMATSCDSNRDRQMVIFSSVFPGYLRTHLWKESGVPTIRFSIQGMYYDWPDTNSVLTITSWPDPAHVVWSINPSSGAWSVLMNGASIGSGTKANAWSGAWAPTLYSVWAGGTGMFYDELKVYGA